MHVVVASQLHETAPHITPFAVQQRQDMQTTRKGREQTLTHTDWRLHTPSQPGKKNLRRPPDAGEDTGKKGSCRDSNAGPLARLLRYPKRESYH